MLIMLKQFVMLPRQNLATQLDRGARRRLELAAGETIILPNCKHNAFRSRARRREIHTETQHPTDHRSTEKPRHRRCVRGAMAIRGSVLALAALAVVFLAALPSASGLVLGIDFGATYFKVALVKPGPSVALPRPQRTSAHARVMTLRADGPLRP